MSHLTRPLQSAVLLAAAIAAAATTAFASGPRSMHPRPAPAPIPGTGRQLPGVVTFPGASHPTAGSIVTFAPVDFDDVWLWRPGWLIGLGWPYEDRGWHGPYYSPGYGTVKIVPADAAEVELHVHPRMAEVRIDGQDLGQARDHDSTYDPIWMRPGAHVMELSYPGYLTYRVKVETGPGGFHRLHYDLQEGQGLDPRSVTAPASRPS